MPPVPSDGQGGIPGKQSASWGQHDFPVAGSIGSILLFLRFFAIKINPSINAFALSKQCC